jgi:MFS family permease
MTPLPGTARTRWYHGWNIVAVCIVSGSAANVLPVNAFSLFLHSWSLQFGAPVSTFQIGFAAFGIGCALIAPWIGTLADRYPVRRMFALGLGSMALFCLGLSLASKVWQFLALFAVLLPFAVTTTTSIPANVLISRWFVRRRGLALSLTAVGLGLGGVIVPPLIAITLDSLGWRTIWRATSIAIAVVILPLTVAVLRERPDAHDGTRYLSGGTKADSTPASAASAAQGEPRWRVILTRRNFWLLVVFYLPMVALYTGCAGNLAPIIASRGLPPGLAGVFLSLLSLVHLLATLAGGILSDRYGNRRPLAGLAAAAASGCALIAMGHTAPVLGAGFTLAGCSGAFWPLVAAAIAAEFGANAVGRVFGMVSFFLPLAVLSPFIVARTQEAAGSYVPALLTLTVLTLSGGAACLLWLRELSD